MGAVGDGRDVAADCATKVLTPAGDFFPQAGGPDVGLPACRVDGVWPKYCDERFELRKTEVCGGDLGDSWSK